MLILELAQKRGSCKELLRQSRESGPVQPQPVHMTRFSEGIGGREVGNPRHPQNGFHAADDADVATLEEGLRELEHDYE